MNPLRKRLTSVRLRAVLLGAALSTLSATYGRADSVLVGTDLSGLQEQGARLCPQASNCDIRAQQFTLLTAVQVSSISVLASGPYNTTAGNFSTPIAMSLVSQFPGIGAQVFWNDTATFMVTGGAFPATTELLTFSGLDLILNPGTYYLKAQGGDVAWGGGNVPLATSAGTLGSFLACDPTTSACALGNGQTLAPDNYGAFDLVGSPVNGAAAQTPEPATWMLSGTGLVALGCLAWSRAARA